MFFSFSDDFKHLFCYFTVKVICIMFGCLLARVLNLVENSHLKMQLLQVDIFLSVFETFVPSVLSS